MRLAPRAETNDPSTLVETFVNTGPLFTLLSSRNHQILYGRRGTGKTHALYYLGEHARRDGDQVAYIDLRIIGSTGGLYNDNSISLSQRATRLLVDTLLAVSAEIYKEILRLERDDPSLLEPALQALGELDDAVTQVRVSGTVTQEAKATESIDQSAGGSVKLTLSAKPAATLSATEDSKTAQATENKRTETGVEEYAVHFGTTSQALAKVLQALPGKRLWILIDEWSVVPTELQPLLADFIRRSLLPTKGLVVKIAAIEQRARFRVVRPEGDYLGIELGADMSADIDFDDFMVFENNAGRAKAFFAELFLRHIRQLVRDEPGSPHAEITALPNADHFVSTAFTQHPAFDELVRSAEGVPRDAINIASLAAQRAVTEKISIPHVRVAARKWYQRDKEGALAENAEALRLLHWIHEEVIGKRRARACLVRQDIGRTDPLLRMLFDSRVVHVVKRGVSGGDVPGIRFDVYALDYGCYVELVTTKVAPTGLLFNNTEEELASDVPGDDYRSIRRAILDIEAFSKSPNRPKR